MLTRTVAVILKAVADAATIHRSVKRTHQDYFFSRERKEMISLEQLGVNRFHTNGEQTDH